ncbi:SoxR reducing system RseC family protein [Pelovirga terrestris]|uniref:SoxR reducing system RseC family protein n=1 Tax=Pelovirga terrestris TaxID=2771352 RepID=A0A8J6UHC3_9BACT|nr:SoxR reducing system RseC family protein [Pelovirga terrestris]MBD1399105.1 SoxR reducing system RseC family protein [Pelovirga terrestris]
MIEELGTVIALREGGRIALVQCHKQTACASCQAVSVCCSGQGKLREVEARNDAHARESDRVRLATSSRNFLRSSFILYILPVLGLLGGAGFGHQLGTVGFLTIDPELMMALSAIITMAIVFGLIYHLTRRLKRDAFMPIIVAVEMKKQQ